MNDTKHNPANAGQDSDDLIAELARLVAQDARTAAAPASAYQPVEPQVSAQDEPVQPAEDDFFEADPGFGAPQDFAAQDENQAERVEPSPDSGQSDAMPAFDFGFGTAHQVSVDDQQTSGDPIANLIADAEVETYESDSSQDQDWGNHDAPLPAEPEPAPSYADYERRDDEFSDAAPVTPADRDPLGDIEALIGEAARANSGDAGLPAGRRVKSSFLDGVETDAAVDAAESAILAAAAATGSSVRRVEPANDPEDWLVAPAPAPRQAEERPEPTFEPQPSQERFIPDPLLTSPATPQPEPAAETASEYADDDYAEEAYAEEQVAPRRSRRGLGGFIFPIAAGAVIFALIGGGYFAFFSGPGDPGEAPVLTADAQPLKEDAPPSQTESAASDSVVFSEIEGNSTSPEDEALVSRDQTNGASGAQVAEVLAPEEGETALANRPVRTVTVRPDGTIVQATDSVAGSNVLPVERPDVPAVPNSTLTSDPIGAAIAQAIAGSETAEAAVGTEIAAADASEAVLGAGVAETAESNEAAVTTPAEVADAPRPIPRPAGLTTQTTAATTPAAASAAPTIETVAAATPAQTTPAPAAAPTPASNVGAWVQLSSQRSEADAQADIPSLQSRYGTLFNGATPEVSQVDLGERGIYYRVRLPQPTFAQANSVCSAIQGQGGDCFVLNN
jgi:hypothetical protein